MKKKWRDTMKKHWVLMRFGPLFVFLLLLFFLFVGMRFFSEIIPVERYFTVAVTHISGTALSFTTLDTRVEGTKIYNDDPTSPVPHFSVDLKTGCNGLVATLIFISAIIAFPSSWKYKLLGILMGIVALQAFNVIRIGVLFYLGLYHPKLFDMVHIYVAQSILIAIAAALWLLWSLWAGKEPSPSLDRA